MPHRPDPYRTATLVCGILLSVFQPRPLVMAAATPQEIVSCASDARFAIKPKLRIHKISFPSWLKKPNKRVRRWSFGPFDEVKYGFTAIEFAARWTPDPLYEGSILGSPMGNLRVIVGITRGSQVTWGNLDTEQSEGTFWIGQRPAYLNTHSKPHFAAVSHAIADTAVPLFRLSYEAGAIGGNNTAEIQTTELLDFRNPQPQALLAVECVQSEGGGACTAWDAEYYDKTSLVCTWVENLSDVECTGVKSHNGGTGHRKTTARMLLGSGTRMPPQNARSGDATDLIGVAMWAAEAPVLPPGPAAFHADVGAVTPLRVLAGGDDRSRIVVMAAPGTGQTIDARFFVARIPKTGDAKPQIENAKVETIGYVGAESGHPETRLFSSSDENRSWASAEQPVFTTKTLFDEGSLTVLQVVGSEGQARAIYWVAIERVANKVVAHALRISGNDEEYQGCPVVMVRHASAFSTTLVEGSRFWARLKLIPTQFVMENLYRDHSSVPNDYICSWRSQVKWKAGTGFVVSHEIKRCPEAPPVWRVGIGDDGSLRAIKDKTSFHNSPR